MRARQRVLRDPWRPARGRGRRRQLPGHLCRRALQPAGQPRSPGARSRTRTWSTSPTGCRWHFRVAGGPWFDVQQAERRSTTAWSWTCATGRSSGGLAWQDAEGRRTRVVQRRFVSMKDEHLAGLETDLHGRELVGDPRGPLRAGRPGGQRRGQALPRPERPPPGGAGPGRGRRGDDRPAGRDQPVARPGRPGRPHQAAPRRRDRRGRPAAGRRARVRRPRAHPRAGAGAAGDRGEDRRPLHLPGPRHLREPRTTPAWRWPAPRTSPGCWPATRAPGAASGTGSTSSWTAPTSGPRPSCTCTSSTCCRPSRPTPPTWTSACRRAAGTGRPTGATSSGTSCSSSRSSTSSGRSLASALLDYRHARLGAARAAARAAGYAGRDVPLAERLQRTGGDPAAPPQPEVGALAARPLPPAAARQHRHRLQRLAALHGHRQHRVPALRRRRAADRDRPLLGQHRHLQPPSRTATRSSA